jgi:hypothetical protein
MSEHGLTVAEFRALLEREEGRPAASLHAEIAPRLSAWVCRRFRLDSSCEGDLEGTRTA